MKRTRFGLILVLLGVLLTLFLGACRRDAGAATGSLEVTRRRTTERHRSGCNRRRAEFFAELDAERDDLQPRAGKL